MKLPGGNPNNIGWNWLGHHPGQPRPSKEINYPTIICFKSIIKF